MQLIDTHCHLDFQAYEEDRDAVIARANEHGVTRIINPAIDIPSIQNILRLSEHDAGIYAAIGIHPNSTASWSPEIVETLKHYTAHPKVVSIGEIGLDYYWDKSPKAVQHAAFEAQLALAAQVKLPIIIHNREASDDVLSILKRWLPTIPDELKEGVGVFHSFSGDKVVAEKVLDMGFYIGFTGPLTFKKADEMRSVAAIVPLDRLLIETDGPFLTPEPYRGKRNEPSYVRFVAERLATIHQIDAATIATRTTANAERLFRLPQI
jgi:TatD DNase family protein